MSDFDENDDLEGYESDTGFSSQGSDEVLENLETGGIKRKHSDDEILNEKEDRECGKNKRLYKPPTAEELNHLKETQNLFHSNLFRMQIEEVLKEILVKEKKKTEFEAWFEKLSKAILKLKDGRNKYNLDDHEWLKKYKIRMPMCERPLNNSGTFQFKKPSQIRLIGSYATNLLIGPKFTVDVLIEMPQSFFQKEDFLNCRYHKKRSLYMCELIHQLQLFPNLVENITFLNEETNNLKPLVEVTPVGKLSKCIVVKLYFCPEVGSFKLSRFIPSKSNIRKKWLFNETENEQDMLPTPFYNSTILADLVVLNNLEFLKETLLMHNNIRDGIILLKIWLKQRELNHGIGGFNGYLVTMLVCYLLQIKKINVLMSSYQVFRNVCNYLATSDWTKNGITLCKTTDDTNIPTMTEFHKHHKVVFLDATGYHNMCFAMSPYTFKQVQHEAQYALECLNNPSINSFQALFISKVPFYQHFDHVVIFNNGEALDNIADNYSAKDSRLNYCTVTSHLARESVLDLMAKGLGKRIGRICPRLPKENRWKIGKKYKQATSLTVGFNLDSAHYFSVLDKALESETETFREFWGEKSELRRFQDGTITEAVVWTGRTLSEKRLICKEIVTYLLKNKLGLDERDFKYVANQVDCYIGKDIEEASLSIIETYDQLVKQLRDLKDLPLDVINVQGVSPVFRYTEVFPPIPQKIRPNQKTKSHTHATILENLNSCPAWISPIDVVIKMAASSKWPQSLEGIKRIRAAFNMKISESLVSQYGVISEPLPDRVELIKNGYVFRLRVVYPNEIALLKKTVDTDGLIKYRDTPKSLVLEKDSVDLPKLSSALHGLYQAHNSFGPACCLIKRWISAHMLDSYHISEECIELLVASLYLKPQPNEPPCQPQAAFFRFHYLLATTNWNTECLILNMNDELSHQDIMEIESEFNANRDSLPPVFIATPYDRKKSVFTRDSPTPLILLRLIELSANALRLIEDNIYSQYLFDSRVLFKPCLDSYDVIITVDDVYNPRKKAVVSTSVDSTDEFRQNIPVNGFDPVSLYLGELRDNYGDFALFFHDTYGGSIIGLVWKPTALEPCEFKVPNLPGRVINSKTEMLELDKNAILEDFWHIGKGLVNKIECKVNGTFKEHKVFRKENEIIC